MSQFSHLSFFGTVCGVKFVLSTKSHSPLPLWENESVERYFNEKSLTACQYLIKVMKLTLFFSIVAICFLSGAFVLRDGFDFLFFLHLYVVLDFKVTEVWLWKCKAEQSTPQVYERCCHFG